MSFTTHQKRALQKCMDSIEMITRCEARIKDFTRRCKEWDDTPWQLRIKPTDYGVWISKKLATYKAMRRRLVNYHINNLQSLYAPVLTRMMEDETVSYTIPEPELYLTA